MEMISSFFTVEKQEDGDESDDEDEFVGVIVLKDMVMVIVWKNDYNDRMTTMISMCHGKHASKQTSSHKRPSTFVSSSNHTMFFSLPF